MCLMLVGKGNLDTDMHSRNTTGRQMEEVGFHKSREEVLEETNPANNFILHFSMQNCFNHPPSDTL